MCADQPEQSINRRGHLQLAASYTRDSWFPALPHTAAKVRSILHPAGGKIDRDLLLTELKRDAAVASALCRILMTSKAAGRCGIGAIREMDDSGIRGTLESNGLGDSKHSMSTLTPWQQSRFQESVVAVSAAETLSSSFNVEGELAFTCALLRQLGLSLLAWNYPHVFKRALNIIRPGETFEQTLGKILGFTPGYIALNILRVPEASPVLLKAIGDSWTAQQLDTAETTVVSQVESLCRLSESLARATSPQAYPSSKADWQTAQREIEIRLGKSGWRILESAIAWHMDGYRSMMPDLFTTPAIISDLSAHGRLSLGEITLFQRNQAAQLCSSAAQRVLKEFYLMILDPDAADAAIPFLLRQAAPRCGFSGAALCRQGPGGIIFDQAAQFGSVSAPLAPAIQTAISSAAAARNPLHGETNGQSWICGSIGETQRSAILYAEYPKTSAGEETKNEATGFRALHQAAGDALKAY